MKRAAVVACLALAAAHAALADGSVLLATAATTVGAKATAHLANTPYAGLGVFASRWDSQDYGTLTGYGVRCGWNVYGPLGLEARAAYYESKDDEIDATLVPLEAALTFRLPLNRFPAPYVGGGVGYYLKDAEYDDDEETRETSEEVAGYFALAGLNLALGPASLFVEAKYNLVGTDDDLHWRGADVEAQNSLDGASFSGGIKLGF